MGENFDMKQQKGGVRYGILRGGSTVVLIKSGFGGTCRGTKDKHLKMAQRLRQRGYSVICASNPYDRDNTLKADEKILREYVAAQAFSDFDLYLVGISDGADHILQLAQKFPQTKKLLAINPSSVSAEDLLAKLSRLPQPEKHFVYGAEDEEFDRVAMLRSADVPNLHLAVVEGADHQFTHMLETYLSLADLL